MGSLLGMMSGRGTLPMSDASVSTSDDHAGGHADALGRSRGRVHACTRDATARAERAWERALLSAREERWSPAAVAAVILLIDCGVHPPPLNHTPAIARGRHSHSQGAA